MALILKNLKVMKEKKIVLAAKIAKNYGYTHIASVVKSFRASTYYHIVSCDSIISNKNWIPAPKNYYGWIGRIGTIGTKIDWTKTITRIQAFNTVDKVELSLLKGVKRWEAF